MKPIGGYFELEFRNGDHYHKNALKLSTARQCLEYILHIRKYKKVYIPYYTCEVILEPIIKLGVQYEYYHIDENLDPILVNKIQDREALLYTNYFGLKQSRVYTLSKQYKNLIIDNAQAFFAKPLSGVDTFYSARKFIGVPDGAYLYIGEYLNKDFPTYNSVNSLRYLAGRLTLNAEAFYSDFQKCENELCNLGIHSMSILSDKILRSLDYGSIAQKRRFNYMLLFHNLDTNNNLHFDISFTNDVPMVYPFWSDILGLRSRLLAGKIYIPKYWQSVLDRMEDHVTLETTLADYLCAIPIDQRYGKDEMNYIISNILTKQMK